MKKPSISEIPAEMPIFAKKLFRQTLLLFLLLPLLLTMFLDVSSAVLDFYGGSYSLRPVLMISQLFAILSDILSPAIFTAAVCVLGYGICRTGLRACRLPLVIALLSPLLLGGVKLGITWILVTLRRVNVTPTAFSAAIFFYLLSVAVEYLLDLLLFLLFFLLFQRSGRKLRQQEGLLAAGKPICRKGSAFYRILSAVVWTQIGLAILNSVISIVGDFPRITNTVKNYGFQSRESVLALLSILLLPLIYTAITAFAIRQLSLIFSAKIEVSYFDLRESRDEPHRKAGKIPRKTLPGERKKAGPKKEHEKDA